MWWIRVSRKRSEAPKASIVVATWNGLELLKKSLPAISKIDYPNYEVIIVDGDSTDGTQNYIHKKFPDFALVKLPKNLGVAGNMNAALPYVEGDFVCFLDNDLVIHSEYLKKVVECFKKNPHVGMVGVHVRESDGRVYSSGFFGRYAEPRMKKHIGEALYVTGVCMAFRTDLLQQLEGFDSNIKMGCDDIDAAIRLRHMGWEISAIPDILGYHLRSRTVRKWKMKAFYYVQLGRMYMFFKNFSPLTAIKLTLLNMVWHTKNVLIYIRKGKISHGISYALNIIEAYLFLPSKAGLIVKERRKIRKRAPDSFLLRFQV